MYIAIEGNIGVGKTTLAALLAKKLDAVLVLEEFAGNNFLPKFYADPERYAFPLELSFLTDRYKQLKDFIATPHLSGQPVVTDYLFIKSRLFANINLEPAEYELFSRVFDIMDLHLPRPDVLIFLHAPVPVLQDHIRRRGRDYEQDIKDSYLERVSKMYEHYLSTLMIPVVIIDTSVFDFTTSGRHLDSLLHLISGKLEARKYYLSA